MGGDDALLRVEPGEEVVGGPGVVGLGGKTRDLRVRGAVDALALGEEVHVAVAAQARMLDWKRQLKEQK